jgi:2Fe-2S ferredoxin
MPLLYPVEKTMARIAVKLRDGTEVTVEAAAGGSIMEVLRAGGVDEIAAICGGCCSCATCQVYIDPADLDRLPVMSDDENDVLDGSLERLDNSRLTCQIPWTEDLDGLRLTVAPTE